MNIATNLQRCSRQFPNKPAIIFEGRTLTYHQLEQRAQAYAAWLHRAGVQKGHRVALALFNSIEFVAAYFGIQKIGGIGVSINPALKRAEIKTILEDCGASVVFVADEAAHELPTDELPNLKPVVVDAQFERALDSLPLQNFPAEQMTAADPAVILYTSGTTGVPKGATLTQNNLSTNVAAKVRYTGMTSADRILLTLPMFHCFGQNAVMNSCVASGATLVLHRRFSLEEVSRSLDQHGITMIFAVPTIYSVLLQSAAPKLLAQVRYCFSAATLLPVALAQAWHERFQQPIYEGYGMTETSPFACYNHIRSYRTGSVGSPIDGISIKIVDVETRCELEPHQQGELIIRGPNVMAGYWNKPTETREVLADGWLRTGDIGMRDEQGYFYLVDRLKDMINLGGVKVYPAEVEQVLCRHPAVKEVAVYGAPMPMLGEQVKARVVLNPGQSADSEALKAFCRSSIARFKVPTQIEFATELPRNATGKVMRRMLRTDVASATALQAEPTLLMR